ncbi:MAG: transporter [Hyphomicrobiales bacterium]|nr:transporter [Hyphomicrobiales bacterium]
MFHIIDPKRLFVEALSHDGSEVGGQASALTTTGHSLPLTFVGAGFADRNQARPIHYRVDGDTHGLRLGQFVTVLARTVEETAGLAVPRASVVRRGNGEDIVYRHATAERFEPRIVRTEPLDAERVLIVAGVDPGARIVTQAAELLNQVR